jgi:hypothetical protein
MLRILAIIALGFVIYHLLKRSFSITKTHAPKKSPDKIPAPTELVMDPNCKTYLARDKAIVHEGNYFCSLECRDKYQQKET